jgi:hypothetical protein
LQNNSRFGWLLSSSAGLTVRDRINLIYTDTPYSFEENSEIVSTYAKKLRAAALAALEEEMILVTVISIYHAA